MAGDLIPPPSPAGRPDPDAPSPSVREELRPSPPPEAPDDLVLAVRPDDDRTAGADREASETPEETAARQESPYRSRFGFITGALLGIGMAATAITVFALAGDDGVTGAKWSSWQPQSDDAYVAASEIADHVAQKYRLNDGGQLVDVRAGPIEVDGTPLNVVVRTRAKGGNIVPIEGEGLWYVMNGLGQRGAIPKETPSVERLALLKREAVELALYTFRYVEDIDHVVALLPAPQPAPSASPEPGATATATAAPPATPTAAPDAAAAPEQPLKALLFRPGDLEAQLLLPVGLSIPPRTPRPGTISKRDVTFWDESTAVNLFDARYSTAQDGRWYLVLERAEDLAGPTLPEVTPEATATATPR